MKIKFFILIVISLCISSCANVFTHHIGRDMSTGDQALADNHSTILERYSAYSPQE